MYRDDRDALLARLDAVTRENEQLRARNAELEHPALPSPATNFEIDSFLVEDEPQPHQTLRGHAPAWVTTRPNKVPPTSTRSRREWFEVLVIVTTSMLAGFVAWAGVTLLGP